ncbi:MAG TPA: phosphoglycerate dehydrogenase [Pseudoclavibacter sp.]|nr:phosphoglycerate dehydrogenase [Pseudoclavibacter sp.]
MKALLLENINPLAIEKLEAHGIEVTTAKGALDEDELIASLPGVDMLGIRSKTQVTKRVLDSAEADGLLAVGAFCIGTNQIDLSAAADRGVTVFNAPYSNTRSVVELAMAEIIMMARRLTDRNADMHAGVWNKSALHSHEVRGRTLGIVGYGNIGSQLSVLAEMFGMRVLFYDIAEKLALGNAERVDTLEELLERAEVITLHVDGRASNKNLFSEREFALMRPRSLFLNLCRGHVVDVDALAAALQSGHIAGASIDVFPAEPKAAGQPFESPLRGIPNVILTPHIGGSTMEAQHNIAEFVSGKLWNYVSQGATEMSVNIPSVTLPNGLGQFRIAHLHKNIPGVMAALNQRFGDLGVNISSQVLGTWGQTGYVVSDVSADVDDEVLNTLAAVPGTIRVLSLGGPAGLRSRRGTAPVSILA